jgi:hypothetical protein
VTGYDGLVGELFAAGYRTPAAMTAASWQDRVDALGRGHYKRYDERTATMLGDAAAKLAGRYAVTTPRRWAGTRTGRLFRIPRCWRSCGLSGGSSSRTTCATSGRCTSSP